MVAQLSNAELQTAKTQLQGFAPAVVAMGTLEHYEGDLELSLMELIAAEAGVGAYDIDRAKLKTIFMANLRRELCGDESFREKLEEYNRNPTKAVLLTGLIVYLVDLVTLPINPAMATIIVLWVLKLGIRVFCDYTEPE
ncbi:MAG: hypothetical protein F6J87_24455 [Spirulina sp. SIO3F2]|nr:hypothetical protein [Spirulina sp. SIO3F2]